MEESNNSITKAQLVLAEKRTALAVLRTAIMIFALPLTVLTALVAFSEAYEFRSNIWLMTPIVIVTTFLLVLAIFLMYRSIRNIFMFDRLLEQIRGSHPDINDLIPCSKKEFLKHTNSQNTE